MRYALTQAVAPGHAVSLASLRLRIRHRPGDAALAFLLAGWFGSRLEWPADRAWPIAFEEARHGDEEKRVGRAAIGLRGEPRRDEGHDGAERDRDEVLAEEQEPVAEAFLAVEVAHVEHHDDTEADQRADREDEPRISSQRIPDARALTGERATEGGRRRGERPGLRVAGRAITQLAQGNASTAARNARPRAA